jgi:hypothetical protein
MNKILLFTFIVVAFFNLSCNGKYDFSNPLDSQATLQAPKNLQIVSITDTAVTLQFEDPNSTSVYPNAKMDYEVEQNSGSNDLKVSNADLNGNRTTVSGVFISTYTYDFRIRVKTAYAISSYSNIASAKISFLAPNNLQITSLTTSQVDLSWQDNSSFEISFEVEQSTDSINYSLIKTVGSNVTSTSITGTYDSTTTYYFRVQAKTAINKSGYSNVVKYIFKKPIPTQGLIAYYPFNGNANDESGKGNNGTVHTATMTTDRYGNANKAYLFNGTSNYIDIGNLGAINDASYSIWMKARSNNSTGALFGVGSSSNAIFFLRYNIGGTFPANKLDYLISTSTQMSQWGYENSSILDTLWHHIVFIRTNSTIGLYIDGSSVSMVLTNNQGNQTGAIIAGLNMAIGAISGTAGISAFFDGSLDDVRIYNRVLIVSEIQTLYHEGGWQ